MSGWPACGFWDFSLGFYARPGVEAACLALQEEGGLDVNLVLLAAWAAACGMELDRCLAARLQAIGEAYQETVMRPCRAARKGLARWPETATPGSPASSVLETFRAIELDLEHLEQLRLADMVEAAEPRRGTDDAALFGANLMAVYPDRRLPVPAVEAIATAIAAAGRCESG